MILGIDPGKTGGYCLMDNNNDPWMFDKINTHNYDAVFDLANQVKWRGVTVCYIEDVYLQFNKLNPKTLLNHAKSIGLIEGVMRGHGIKVILVPAKTWQSQVLPKQSGKGSSLAFANLIGAKTKNHNIADAVCIAHYGHNNERILNGASNNT